MITVIDKCPIKTKIWFEEEKRPYSVRAVSERYIVCTKPFNLRHTVLYTIIDLKNGMRGTENLLFITGAETDEQCEYIISRLTDPYEPTFLSRRNSIPARITKIQLPKE